MVSRELLCGGDETAFIEIIHILLGLRALRQTVGEDPHQIGTTSGRCMFNKTFSYVIKLAI